MAKIIGIDLGTTNSVVAVMHGGEPIVIPTAEGSRLCPSVVAFTKAGERLVGQLAKRQAITNPERTVLSIKRHMGSDFKFELDGRAYAPPEISAMILQKLRTDAESYLGEKVRQAVITVPAYFSDGQRQATKDAGRIAGLEVVRIINEPTAASLAYGLDKEDIHTVLVWDLGGGTFDVSILELGEGVFEVKATCGDTWLGGDDWDEAVMHHLAQEFQAAEAIDLFQDRTATQRLKEAAEKAKMELSTMASTTVNLPFITASAQGPRHLEVALTRAKFQELTAGLLERMVGPTKQAMADSRMQPKDIGKVILVGGATRMPAVIDLVREMFDREPHKGINPDEVVALGAAIQAGVLSGEVKDIVLLDVTPLSLGVETLGGVFTRLIERNTTIPTSKTQVFTTSGDNQTAVDVHVLQGEREMAADNKSLGRFQLQGVEAAPRGVPRIQVTFEIDVNGISHVSARDTATGKEQNITVTASSGLSEREVERMVHEAEAYAETDHRRREHAEARNRTDQLAYQAEQLLGEHGEQVPPGVVALLQSTVNDARRLLAATDATTSMVLTAGNALEQGIAQFAQVLYPRPRRPSEQGPAEFQEPDTDLPPEAELGP